MSLSVASAYGLWATESVRPSHGFERFETSFSFRAFRATFGRFPVERKVLVMKDKLQNLRRLARDNAARLSVAVMTLPVAMAANAQAVDPFDAALNEVKGKVGGYGASLVGLAAVAVVFFVAIKYVKKIPRAS